MLEFDREQKMIKFDLDILQVSLSPESNIGMDMMNNLSIQAAYQGVSSEILSSMFAGAPSVIGSGLNFSSSNSPSKETFVIGASQLNSTLNFAKSFSNVETLQSPELITREGFPSYFFIGRTETVAIPGGTSTSGGVSGSPEILEFSFGDVLALTPTILNNDSIYLSFNFETSREGDASIYPTEAGDIAIPGTSTQRRQQILEIPDGKTIVLSGYLSTTESETLTKTPLLGNIPFLGSAFRNTQKSKTWLNTLILITPHILETKTEVINDTKEMLHRFNSKTQNALVNAKIDYGVGDTDDGSLVMDTIKNVIDVNNYNIVTGTPVELEIKEESPNFKFGIEPYEHKSNDYPGIDEYAPNPQSEKDTNIGGIPYTVPQASLFH